jgi:hypothetical protein
MTFLAPSLYILKHVGILVLLTVSSCGFGLWGAKFLKINSDQEDSSGLEGIFFLFCLGLGIWSYAIFCLGTLHLIYKSALALIFVLSLLPYISLFKQRRQFELKISKSSLWRFCILLSIITVPVFVRSLYCASGWDDTMYHLPVARAFLDAHYLVPTPFLRYVVFNNFTNLLFVPLFAIGGDTAAQQLSVASFIFCGAGIYACLKRFNSENAGLIGLLAWSSSALFWDLGSTALVDMNLALMGLAGVFAALKVFESSDSHERNRYATLAGIYFGCTIASKLLGALLVVSFTAAVNVANLATNRLQFDKIRTDFLTCIKMMLIVGLITAPWLIRSFLVTDNPIWPFGEKIFGLGHLWSAFDYNSQADSLAATKGLARNASNFFILPWLMSFGNSQFDQLTFTPFLGFGIYLGLPLLFAKGFRSTKVVFGTVFCFLLLWFVSTQQVRYLMAAAPVICILGGAVLDRYLKALVAAPKLRFRLLTIMSIAVLAFGFEHIAYADMWANWARLPYNQARRIEYLNSRLPMFATMNTFSVLPKGKIYGLEMENMQFFSNGQMIGDWFGPARYEDFRQNKTTGETLYQHLQGLDVKYLVVNLGNTAYFELPTDTTFKQHFRNIFTDGKGVIYELRN